MKIYPRLNVNITGLLFVLLFTRLSYWQWERHVQKKAYIQTLETRLSAPPEEISKLVPDGFSDWQSLSHRRALLRGIYDYDHEMILRNRRYEELPGAFVLTPLQLEGSAKRILISRGFVPFQYTDPKKRIHIQRPKSAVLTVLIKESVSKRFLAPEDPETGDGRPWVDAFLRVDIPKIQKQLPYELLPIYGEIMETTDPTSATKEIIRGKDERNDMFNPTSPAVISKPTEESPSSFPKPVFDTVVPAGRHLGYVYEWGAMAIATILICLVLQLRPRRITIPNEKS